MVVRPAKHADANGINLLVRYLDYPPLNAVDIAQNLQRLLDSNTDHVMVAECDKRIVGWIHAFTALRLASTGFWEIGGLVVDPTYRRSGIGRALVTHLLQTYPGSWRVRCNEVRDEALSFYSALGFDLVKTQHVLQKHN